MAFVVPAIASAIGTIGTAAAGAATAVGTGLGSMASLGTVLQGGVSALSALQSMSGGSSTEASMPLVAAETSVRQELLGLEGERAKVDAAGIDLDAELTRLDAERTAMALRRDLGKQIGSQRVAFAASGVDPTSGTAALTSQQLTQAVDEDIRTVRSDAGRAARMKHIAADMTRSGATAARIQQTLEGLAGQGRIAQLAASASSQRVDALSTVASWAGDYLKRGV